MIGFSNLDSLICLCGARNRFGALAFARHPVISGLGAAAAISILSIFCASLCVAPAWAKISGEGSGGGR